MFSMGAPDPGEQFPPFNLLKGSKLKRAKGSKPEDFRRKPLLEIKKPVQDIKKPLWSPENLNHRPENIQVFESDDYVNGPENSFEYSADIFPTGPTFTSTGPTGHPTGHTTRQSTRPMSKRPNGQSTRQSVKQSSSSPAGHPNRGYHNLNKDAYPKRPKRKPFSGYKNLGMIGDLGKFRHQKKLNGGEKVNLTPADSKQYFPKNPSLTYFPQNSIQPSIPNRPQKYPTRPLSRPQSYPAQTYPMRPANIPRPQTYPAQQQTYPTQPQTYPTIPSRPHNHPAPSYTQAPLLFQPLSKPVSFQLSSAARPSLFKPNQFGGGKKRRAPPKPEFKDRLAVKKPGKRLPQSSAQDLTLVQV